MIRLVACSLLMYPPAVATHGNKAAVAPVRVNGYSTSPGLPLPESCSLSRCFMEMLDRVREGFQGIEADAGLKDQALKTLGLWLTAAEFRPYQPQLNWLIQAAQWAGLLDRFYQILPFGTGGRRGPVGIGPNRMNLWTLGASVQGHCEYLKERFPGIERLQVVVAYDVRRFEDQRRQYNPALPNPVLHLSSRDLAQHAVGIYVANGVHATILPPDSTRYLATPELSFLIRQLHAHGGLNISASHNPPDDNGGKFYDERGGQPVPPEDQIMADLQGGGWGGQSPPMPPPASRSHPRPALDRGGPHRPGPFPR